MACHSLNASPIHVQSSFSLFCSQNRALISVLISLPFQQTAMDSPFASRVLLVFSMSCATGFALQIPARLVVLSLQFCPHSHTLKSFLMSSLLRSHPSPLISPHALRSSFPRCPFGQTMHHQYTHVWSSFVCSFALTSPIDINSNIFPVLQTAIVTRSDSRVLLVYLVCCHSGFAIQIPARLVHRLLLFCPYNHTLLSFLIFLNLCRLPSSLLSISVSYLSFSRSLILQALHTIDPPRSVLLLAQSPIDIDADLSLFSADTLPPHSTFASCSSLSWCLVLLALYYKYTHVSSSYIYFLGPDNYTSTTIQISLHFLQTTVTFPTEPRVLPIHLLAPRFSGFETRIYSRFILVCQLLRSHNHTLRPMLISLPFLQTPISYPFDTRVLFVVRSVLYITRFASPLHAHLLALYPLIWFRNDTLRSF